MSRNVRNDNDSDYVHAFRDNNDSDYVHAFRNNNSNHVHDSRNNHNDNYRNNHRNNYRNNHRNNHRNNYSNNRSRSRRRSNHWRDSYDYRREYLRRNPGLFGKLFFCGYCGKPIWGAENLHVDHIIPPSKFSKKVYKRGELVRDSSFMAFLLNHPFDLVAACPECNMKKSDKITPTYVVKGFGSKAFRKTLWCAGSTVSAGLLLGAFGLNKGVRLVGKAVSYPVRSNAPGEIKIVYVTLVVLLILAFVLFQI